MEKDVEIVRQKFSELSYKDFHTWINQNYSGDYKDRLLAIAALTLQGEFHNEI